MHMFVTIASYYIIIAMHTDEVLIGQKWISNVRITIIQKILIKKAFLRR